MAITRQTKKQFIYSAKIYIESAGSDEFVKEQIQTIGYDENRLNEGLELQKKAHESRMRQISTRNNAKSLHTRMKNTFRSLYREYLDDIRLFKSTFIRDIAVKERLGLYGRTKRNVPGFIEQARSLYKTLANEPVILSRLEKFNITADTINTKLNAIDELTNAYKAFVEADKEAQDATDESGKDYGKLIDWIRELQDACRIVLKGRPQLQEKVGILVRSSKPAKKKKEGNENGNGNENQDNNETGGDNQDENSQE